MWDDDTAIVTNDSIRGSLWTALTPPLERPVSGRPIVNLSFAINYALGGLDATGYHVWNLIVHIACALLLFGIVRRTLQGHPRESRARLPADALALIAAVVWLVHPLQTEVVDYVTQRSESMMALFVLLTLYAAIRGRQSLRRGPWDAAAIVSCALAMATKESAVMTPILVLLYDRVFAFESFAAAARTRRTLYLGLCATWLELGAIMWRWPRSTVGVATVSSWTYLLNQLQMIAGYMRLTVWPRALVFDYGLPRPLGLGDVVPAACVVLGAAVATGLALFRWPAIGFLGLTFFLALAPTSSIVPIASEVGAERRMYLPLAALVVLAVIAGYRAVEWLSDRAVVPRATLVRTAATAVAAVVVALAAATVARNRDYQSPLTLWQTVVDRRPQGRARMSLASELIAANRRDEAVPLLRQALTDFPDARAALGAEFFFDSRFDDAIRELREFIRTDPERSNRIPARVLLGQALAGAGQLDDAERELRVVADREPSNPLVRQALADLGFGYRRAAESALKQNRPAEAAARARDALRLDTNDGDAHNLLGVALATTGRLDEAIAEFRQAVALNKDDRRARDNLARALSLGRGGK